MYIYRLCRLRVNTKEKIRRQKKSEKGLTFRNASVFSENLAILLVKYGSHQIYKIGESSCTRCY
jgi:hypothetical protein